MFSACDTAATVAVKDLAKARAFYEQTLGLEALETSDEAITYRTGSTQLIVYQSQFAGSNKATAVNWLVGDKLESLVKKLGEKGVQPERYDMPEMRESGGIYSNGDFKVAWFKDPDGNIFSMYNETATSQQKAA